MRRSAGFSLIELMIVVAIIGVLAVLVVPSYQVYVRRARYVQVVQAASPLKMRIQECFAVTSDLSECGPNSLTPQVKPHGLVKSVTIQPDTSIKVIPKEKYGITSQDDYTLTPVVKRGQLHWISGGGGVAHGYAN
jgi:type IV pilus assembly protein PilA